MPRRKRRKSSSRWHPLDFEESPKHVVTSIPSPAFCSDHPTKARVVPIDLDSSFPWVSPQFSGRPTPHAKGRGGQLRRRRKSSGLSTTRSRNKSGKNANDLLAGPQTRSRKTDFVSLKFIGETDEPTTCPESSQDEMLQDENQPPGGTRGTSHDGDCKETGNKATRFTKLKNCEKGTLPLSNTRHMSSSLADLKEPFADTEGPSCPNDLETPDLPTTESDAELKSGTDKNKPGPSVLGSVNRSGDTVSGTDSDIDILTQKRQVKGKRKTKKRLFDSSTGSESESLLDPHPKENCRSTLNRSKSDKSRVCGSERTPDNRRRSLRIQALHNQVFAPLLNTPTQMSPGVIYHKVLVYDTPEEDYGLSVRQRRLKLKGRRSSMRDQLLHRLNINHQKNLKSRLSRL